MTGRLAAGSHVERHVALCTAQTVTGLRFRPNANRKSTIPKMSLTLLPQTAPQPEKAESRVALSDVLQISSE